MDDTVLLIVYKKDSDEIEKLAVTGNRDWAVEQFKKYEGRATIANYRIGDTYKLPDNAIPIDEDL